MARPQRTTKRIRSRASRTLVGVVLATDRPVLRHASRTMASRDMGATISRAISATASRMVGLAMANTSPCRRPAWGFALPLAARMFLSVMGRRPLEQSFFHHVLSSFRGWTAPGAPAPGATGDDPGQGCRYPGDEVGRGPEVSGGKESCP